MDIELAALGLRADAQVFERAADDAHAVTLEVGERDKRVRRGDCLGYVRLFEQVAFGDVHAEVACADKAVRADERAAQRGGVVAVALGGEQDVQLACARAPRRVAGGCGVADKRPAAQLLDAVGERARVHRAQVGGIVPLAAMHLDGDHIVGLDHPIQPGGVEDGQHLRHETGLSGFRMRVHIENIGFCHIYPP